MNKEFEAFNTIKDSDYSIDDNIYCHEKELYIIEKALIKAQSQEKEYILLANLIYNLVSTGLINFRVRTLRSGITEYSIFDAEEYQHIQIDKDTFEAVDKVMEDFSYEEEIGIQ